MNREKNLIKSALISLIITSSSVTLAAQHSGGEDQGAGFMAFQLAAIGVVQGSGNSFSGIVSWTPTLHFSQGFGLRMNLGGTLLLDSSANKFYVIDAEALLFLKLGQSFGIEAGGGAQDWLASTTAIAPAATAGIFIEPGRFLGLFERLFVDGTYLLFTTPAYQVRAGVGIYF